MLADADEGACGDESLSEGGATSFCVDGPDEAGVGVNVWDERAGDVCGVVEDTEPEFRREIGHGGCTPVSY